MLGGGASANARCHHFPPADSSTRVPEALNEVDQGSVKLIYPLPDGAEVVDWPKQMDGEVRDVLLPYLHTRRWNVGVDGYDGDFDLPEDRAKITAYPEEEAPDRLPPDVRNHIRRSGQVAHVVYADSSTQG